MAAVLKTEDSQKSLEFMDDDDIDQYEDRVAAFYIDKTVLITGGSGFMGKVLIEKLLRCCTKIQKIYLLLRSKKGKDPNERLKDIFSNPLFDALKKQQGEEVLKKVEAISGDCMEVNLGLSSKDRIKLCEEVDLIVHLAATIRFDEGLRKAVLLNVRGTKYMLDLATEMQRLTGPNKLIA